MIDFGLIGLFLLAIAFGYRKGFVGQIVGFIGVILSLFIAYSFARDAAVFLQNQFPLPQSSSHPLIQSFLDMALARQSFYLVLSFLLLFFFARLLCKAAGKFLQSIVELPFLSFVNRCCGAAFGFGKALILVFVLVQFAAFMPEDWQRWVHQSAIAQYMMDIAPNLSDRAPKIPNFTEAVNI